MTSHRSGPARKIVQIEAYQRNGRVTLDHYVYDEYVPGTRQRYTQRRVVIDIVEPLSHIQLTLLVKKMAEFVTAKVGPGHGVPQGLPYQEIGLPRVVPVPPDRGGRGGGNPVEEPTERLIPQQRNESYHQSTPSSAGDERVARNRSSDLDLPVGWVEVPLWPDL